MKFEFNDRSQVMNVVPLNATVEMILPPGFLDRENDDLDLVEDTVGPSLAMTAPKYLVRADQFPDQSMHVLDMQMKQLRERMDRLKFYLADVEDLIPEQV